MRHLNPSLYTVTDKTRHHISIYEKLVVRKASLLELLVIITRVQIKCNYVQYLVFTKDYAANTKRHPKLDLDLTLYPLCSLI